MKPQNLKKLAFLSFTAFFVSCGLSDDDSPEACKFEVEQALDKGNYDYVIQKLENNPTCGGGYSYQEGRIQLAAAYIGKAGFDIPSLIQDIIKSGSDNEDTDNYALFTQTIAKRATGDALNYLNKAKKYYEEISSDYQCDNLPPTAPDIVKDACFYSGLTDTAKATTSIALLIGGDAQDTNEIVELIDKWANASDNTGATCDENDINANGIPDSADASACALKYSVALSDDDNTNEGIPYDCGDNITIVEKQDGVVFSKPSTVFTSLKITIGKSSSCSNDISSSKTFKRLIYDLGQGIYSTAISDGYCDTQRNECSNIEASNCYPCPVVAENVDENGQTEEIPVSTADAIIETINNGIDSIIAVIPEDETGDTSSLKEDVNEFKKDLCSYEPNACKCDTDGDGIAESDCDTTSLSNAKNIEIKKPSENPEVQNLIADYLQKQK